MAKKSITPRSEDYAQWYLDVIDAADMAEHSIVRGSMVIKPNGYAVWEHIQAVLDGMIKMTGHKNLYFPLFIPKSLLSKEADHVKGFAKECAIVTHYRLREKADGTGVEVDPEAKLDEELIVRPTSETIINSTYAKWVESYRDLPLLYNQWANVVRWEMRTRFFLRTSEFLWQEGHTAHATYEEAEVEATKMLNVYVDLAQNYLAIPVIPGTKSKSETFPGADYTYTIEAMMQDGKALQAGTSHNLGQNFAKAFEIKFTDQDGQQKFVNQTSWGVSTRIIGGLIMTHSDDKGLVLPPKIAPTHVVIVPIWKTDEEKEVVLAKAHELQEAIFNTEVLSCELDTRDFLSPGAKFNEYEKKGIPARIEIGPRDVQANHVIIARRDTSEKNTVAMDEVGEYLVKLMEEMQTQLFERAKEFRQANTHQIDDYNAFKKQLEQEIPGFIYAHWCESEDCEAAIKEETKATTRCVPLDQPEEAGSCIKCGAASKKRIIFAKAY